MSEAERRNRGNAASAKILEKRSIFDSWLTVVSHQRPRYIRITFGSLTTMEAGCRAYCRVIREHLDQIEVVGVRTLKRRASYIDAFLDRTVTNDAFPDVAGNKSDSSNALHHSAAIDELLSRPAAPRRVVVSGGPGSGKSEFLRQLAWRAASITAAGALGIMPVRLHCRPNNTDILAPFDPTDPWKSIAIAARPRSAHPAHRLRQAELLSLARRGQLLVLLDGYDEVLDDDHRLAISAALRAIAADALRESTVVVASRPVTGRELRFDGPALRLSLRPFSEEEVHRYAAQSIRDPTRRKWLAEQDALRSAAMRRVLSQPLMLALFCGHLAEQCPPLRLPRASELMQRWLDELLHRRRSLRKYADGHARALQVLASTFYLTGKTELEFDRALRVLTNAAEWDPAIRAAYGANVVRGLRVLTHFSGILSTDPYLKSVGYAGGLEPLVQYLAACQVVRGDDSSVIALFGTHAWNLTWAAVWPWVFSLLWSNPCRRPLAHLLLGWLCNYIAAERDDALGTLVVLAAELLSALPPEPVDDVNKACDRYTECVFNSRLAKRWHIEFGWQQAWSRLPYRARHRLAHRVVDEAPQRWKKNEEDLYTDWDIEFLGTLGVSCPAVIRGLQAHIGDKIPYSRFWKYVETLRSTQHLDAESVASKALDVMNNRNLPREWWYAARVIDRMDLDRDAAANTMLNVLRDRSAAPHWISATRTLSELRAATADAERSLMDVLTDPAAVTLWEDALRALPYVWTHTADVSVIAGLAENSLARHIWPSLPYALSQLTPPSVVTRRTVLRLLRNPDASEAWDAAAGKVDDEMAQSPEGREALLQVLRSREGYQAWTTAASKLSRLSSDEQRGTLPTDYSSTDEQHFAACASKLVLAIAPEAALKELIRLFHQPNAFTSALVSEFFLWHISRLDARARSMIAGALTDLAGDAISRNDAEVFNKISAYIEAVGVADDQLDQFSQKLHGSALADDLVGRIASKSRSMSGLQLALSRGAVLPVLHGCEGTQFTVTLDGRVVERRSLVLLPDLLGRHGTEETVATPVPQSDVVAVSSVDSSPKIAAVTRPRKVEVTPNERIIQDAFERLVRYIHPSEAEGLSHEALEQLEEERERLALKLYGLMRPRFRENAPAQRACVAACVCVFALRNGERTAKAADIMQIASRVASDGAHAWEDLQHLPRSQESFERTLQRAAEHLLSTFPNISQVLHGLGIARRRRPN